MGMRLDSPDLEGITFPAIESVPDGPEDKPTPGLLLEERIGPLHLPELISGAAAWSHFYNEDETLSTDVPLRTIRLALRYGIRAFDTAPFYDNSEIVLGTALKALERDFPRSTYQLITKVGRYGPAPSDFDYSPTALRASYLDVVYLHDVEYIAPCIAPRAEGNHASALGAEATAYGLRPRTAGSDERVLEAIEALRALQAEGLIRHDLPLPALLRTAQLVLERTARPLDAVQAYAHLTLQNGTLTAFARALRTRARVAQAPRCVPARHGPPRAPARATRAVRVVGEGEVARVAVAWSVRTAQAGDGSGGQTESGGGGKMPVVVGMSDLREVHAAVEAWRWARDKRRQDELESKAALARGVFERTGTAGWTWPSGNWV
ncbi:Aldo/keto reductase [Lactarius vividus]|nr:Aldo/keto reductase [Lactarius vividus]